MCTRVGCGDVVGSTVGVGSTVDVEVADEGDDSGGADDGVGEARSTVVAAQPMPANERRIARPRGTASVPITRQTPPFVSG